MSKTVAVAMIVKNEEALLARCLESVKEADAIYILDTGSQDRTIEIAQKYTDNVFIDYVWTDNFAEAQNVIKSRVPKEFDWILSIDADEVLQCSFEEVRKAAELGRDTVRVQMIAEGGEKNDFGFPRLFRNSPDIYWNASIHKVLSIPGEGEPVGNVTIMYGHSPAHNRDQHRSLRMLERAVELGEGLPRNLYYLGREYWYKQRYPECAETLKKYIANSNWEAEMAEACLVLAQCYAAMGRGEDAAMACFQAILINSNFKEAINFMAEITLPQNQEQWRRMARGANNEGVLWKRTEVQPPNDVIFLAPHNDDESLFGAYTIMREKPMVIVVTDSYIQPERGDKGCEADVRRKETIAAMKIAECPVLFLGIKDTELTEELLRDRLKFINPSKVYAPALQGGNPQHDIVSSVATELFGRRCMYYTTYTEDKVYTTGVIEVKPTNEEMDMKGRMLNRYLSQLRLGGWLYQLFNCQLNKSEWLSKWPSAKPLKRAIITPYFGAPPEWMDKFQPPSGYEWIRDHDLEKFKERVRSKLGIEFTGEWGGSKLWDYRGVLGDLYKEELKRYDYWATMDFDMVFGDVNKWFPDEALADLDIWSNHHEYICGPWTLYRNCKEVNELFMRHPNWKEILSNPETTGWVEKDYSRIVEQSGLRYKYSFMQGDPYHPPFNLKKEDGKLYQNGEEIPMLHFRHDKRWPL